MPSAPLTLIDDPDDELPLATLVARLYVNGFEVNSSPASDVSMADQLMTTALLSTEAVIALVQELLNEPCDESNDEDDTAVHDCYVQSNDCIS